MGVIMSKKIQYRAGLIPYCIDDKRIQMMFMYPTDTNRGSAYYQIAKGKVEDGETFEEAAIREAGEELGFSILNLDGELVPLGTHLGRTEFYMCKIKNKSMFTETTSETEKTTWMTPEEFDEVGRPLHKPIIKLASRKIVERDGEIDGK
jgi:8-oxo-dGTP pyrophosphatase MutT (NUDIX family)